MSPSEQPERNAPGYVLAERFRIVRFLGRGGMGEVYEAADLVLNQHVALKLIRPESRTDPRLVSLLRDEVRKARSVSHANVCRVYDLELDEATGLSFVIMELLRGETLQARLNRAGPFLPAEALPILRQIADGIDAIHAQQMVHLDLKPGNVMLESQNGSAPRAVVNDFGLAQSHAAKDSSDSTESLLEHRGGTPLYMAPERFCRGAALTAAADVYAFGLIAYEMLAGSAWPGPPGIAPPSLRAAVPGVPSSLDKMVRRCLSPQPQDRFPSCGAALESLKVGHEATAWMRPWKTWSRRHLAIAGIGLASVAGVAALWTSGPEPTPAALRWYNEGIEAIREATYYKAVRALDQSLKESPGFPPTHASLAEAWLELDSPERAAEEMLAATGPGAARYRISSRRREILQAIRHTVTRDFASAAADYKRLAESAPADERPRAIVDFGRALERTREPRKAMEQFEAAIRLDPNYGGAYLRLGTIAGQLQLPDKMTQALQRAESLYEASSNLEGVTQVFYQRGTYALLHGHLTDAAEWLERARQAALVTRNPHQQIRALHQLSAVAYQKGDTAGGQKFAEEAIRQARSNNIEFLAGRSFIDLGNTLSTRGDRTQAVAYLDEALRIARNYHSGYLEALALANLGAIGIRAGADESAARQVQQALDWFQTNGYPREASTCLVHLGRFRLDRGELDEAASAFHKQLELAQASHDDSQTALASGSIASVLIRQERFPEALGPMLRNLSISQQLGNGIWVGYAQQSLARIYAELGRFGESAAAAEAAEAIGRDGKLEELLAYVEVERAHRMLLAGRTSDAAATADEHISAYETKFPREAADLLEIKVLALSGMAPSTLLPWCERAGKLAQGSAAAALSLRLTEANLHLRAREAQKALEICRGLRPAFERQQKEYSLFRAELIEALANRQLGTSAREAVQRADEALQRFQKRFDKPAWELFRLRPEFMFWEKNLRQLRASTL